MEEIIDLSLDQLHYSNKAIEYIKVKKKLEIDKTLFILENSKIPKTYKLSVYYYDTVKNIRIYHVYGDENGSGNGSEDAFILGAILDNKHEIMKDKISIKGVLHPENTNQEKDKIELSNLNKMFGGFAFKLHPKTGIEPIFTLDKRLIKSKKSIYNIIDNKHPTEYINSLKKRYEEYGYHDASCPKGSPFCIHFCDYYDKVIKQCTFKCPFKFEICDTNCQYYVDSRLLHCLYTKIKDMSKENSYEKNDRN